MANEQAKGTCETFGQLLKNKPYFFITLNLSLLYFINTNLQFWMSDYLVEINNVPY